MIEEDVHSALLSTPAHANPLHRRITGRCVDRKHGRKSVEFTCEVRYL
jgi:hypothetical protein